MSRQIILNFLNFLLTIIKKCGIILGLAGGVPVDNLWISRPRRDFSLALHSSTALQTDFVSLLHCVFGAQTLFRFDTALRIGAVATAFSKSQAGGIPQN